MKRIIVFLLFLFVSMGVAYSGEMTLGLGWRISDSGLALGEYPLPLSLCRIIEYKDEVYGVYRKTETRDYTLSKDINPFQRRACVVFGLDFNLCRKLSLGFELNAGYVEREINVRFRHVVEVNDVIVVDEYAEDSKEITTIIPANLFVLMKYKFSDAKVRPYFGIGGGLNATIFLKGITEFDENGKEMGEKTFTYSGALVGLAGVDLFFSKKVGIFIEFRYIKPLSEGENFRNQTTVRVGFRFIK